MKKNFLVLLLVFACFVLFAEEVQYPNVLGGYYTYYTDSNQKIAYRLFDDGKTVDVIVNTGASGWQKFTQGNGGIVPVAKYSATYSPYWPTNITVTASPSIVAKGEGISIVYTVKNNGSTAQTFEFAQTARITIGSESSCYMYSEDDIFTVKSTYSGRCFYFYPMEEGSFTSITDSTSYAKLTNEYNSLKPSQATIVSNQDNLYGSGSAMLITHPELTLQPGETVTYEYIVTDTEAGNAAEFLTSFKNWLSWKANHVHEWIIEASSTLKENKFTAYCSDTDCDFNSGLELEVTSNISRVDIEILPENAKNNKLIWKLSTSQIVEVEDHVDYALVRPLKKGKTKVRAVSSDVSGAFDEIDCFEVK